MAIAYIPAKVGGWGHIFARSDAHFKATPPHTGALLTGNNQLQYVDAGVRLGGRDLPLPARHHRRALHQEPGRGKRRSPRCRSTASCSASSRCSASVALAGKIKPLIIGGKANTNTIIPSLFEDLPALVRRHGIRHDHHRRAGPVRGHVDRRRQPVHPQHLQGVPATGRVRRTSRPRSPRSARWWSRRARSCSSCCCSPQFSINLQLIGGVIILQALPAVFVGLYTRWPHRGAARRLGGGHGAGVWMLYVTPNPAANQAHWGGTGVRAGTSACTPSVGCTRVHRGSRSTWWSPRVVTLRPRR